METGQNTYMDSDVMNFVTERFSEATMDPETVFYRENTD